MKTYRSFLYCASPTVKCWLDPVFRLFHTELETVYEEKNTSLDSGEDRLYEEVDKLYLTSACTRSTLFLMEDAYLAAREVPLIAITSSASFLADVNFLAQ